MVMTPERAANALPDSELANHLEWMAERTQDELDRHVLIVAARRLSTRDTNVEAS